MTEPLESDDVIGSQSDSDMPAASDPPGDQPSFAEDDALEGAAVAAEIVEWELPPKPGPGFPEAIVWTIGCLLLQIIGVTAVTLLIVIGRTVSGQPVTRKFLENLETEYMAELSSAGLLTFLVGAILAASVRLGFQLRRRLALSTIPPGHCLLIFGVFVPLSIVCGNLQSWAVDVYSDLSTQFPFLPEFETLETVKLVTTLAEQLSLPFLVALIAVIPALGEELVFRGVIGRGLVARWGIVSGILVTSLLFGLVHGHPAHAFGVFPLAIVFHVTYLATRSFWAPVLLHFLNNTLAVVLLKAAVESDVLDDEARAPIGVMIAAAVVVVALVALIWQKRARFYLPDGTVWNPGYVTAEMPPDDQSAIRTCASADRRLIAFAAVSFVAFLIVGALSI